MPKCGIGLYPRKRVTNLECALYSHSISLTRQTRCVAGDDGIDGGSSTCRDKN